MATFYVVPGDVVKQNALIVNATNAANAAQKYATKQNLTSGRLVVINTDNTNRFLAVTQSSVSISPDVEILNVDIP